MPARPRLTPAGWLRLPARTARMRLTLLYGALFLVCGAGLLTITYLLVSRTGDAVYFHTDGVAVVREQNPAGAGHGVHQGLSAGGKTSRPADAGKGANAVPGAQAIRAVAEIRAQHALDLHHLLIWSAVALAVMAALSAALGYYIAGRVLEPLRTIAKTARAITARNLQERLALDGPADEFKELGDTLDDLLARLQAAFEAQQHFVSNASHELRTPLTVEHTLLQLALADPDASTAELRSTCEKALAANRQQQGLVEALLTLATSERGLDHHEPTDLAVLASAVLPAARLEAEKLGLGITTTIDPAPITGHPALLERLIANLIDNAIRYNTAGGHVDVRTSTTADRHAQLLVTNTGPQVPTNEIERLFEPFQRLSATRANGQSGYGLGLSIVQAIATAHDADIRAEPQPDGGLAIEVSFPLVRARSEPDTGRGRRLEANGRQPRAIKVAP
jgi:signal transduction histidine kinase